MSSLFLIVFGIGFMLIYVDFELILELILMAFGLRNAAREGKGDCMETLCFPKVN